MQDFSNNAAPPASAPPPAETASGEAIAIVGIGCRYPGADNPAAFWRLLEGELDMVREVPSERWKVDAFYDPNPLAPGKMNTRWGGFLERVDQFEPSFFGISPREAICMDPQQRLLLEVAWEALEDGGQVAQQMAGMPVGVFIGLSSNDYGRSQGDLSAIEPYMGTGNANSIAANRLSYFFDFRGPSVTVDTACSSSLVAIHLACSSIRNQECSTALVGGANLVLWPGISIAFTKAGMMSPDGCCKAFDASANGYVRGEGVGVVVLKTLSVALADGDPIYSVILGTAVNQDGRSNGLTAPNRRSQEMVIRTACQQAGVSPGQLDYVEAHGTGTALGDAIECRALANVLAEGRQHGRPCVLGSVKTNIGHLEAAAGVASLIKTALALKHRRIPASLHFKTPNPMIRYEDRLLKVQTRTGPWPDTSRPRLAGINSFGFGGTNAHVILAEGPAADNGREPGDLPDLPYVLPLSARAPEGLRLVAKTYHARLAGIESGGDRICDICFTAGARRTHHAYRLALVGRTHQEIADKLNSYLEGRAQLGIYSGHAPADRQPRLAFVFPGQGTRLHGAGRQLMNSQPIFRQKLEECDALFRIYQPWSIIDEIRSDEDRLSKTEFAQPVIFALQTALAALWQSRGFIPAAVLGHSVGEIAAAHFAGALKLSDAVRIVYHRASVMQRAAGLGRMAAVHTSSAGARRLLSGYEDRIGIAACNTAELTVLSGETSALSEILDLRCKTIPHEYLPLNYAFHSEQMAPFQREFIEAIGGLEPRSASSPAMCSTVSGDFVTGSKLDPDYWWSNIRQTVMFSAATDTVLGQGFDTFIEISAHPALLAAVGECAKDMGRDVLLLPSLRHGSNEDEQMSATVARMYVSGRPIAWRQLHRGSPRHTALPLYPWTRESFWHPAILREGTPRIKVHEEEHPLLGWRLATAQPVWEASLDLARLPYLAEHRVQGTVVLPGAAYLEAALSGAAIASNHRPGVLSNVRFERPLVLPDIGACRLQTMLTPLMENAYEFRVYSQAEQGRAAWLLHASGAIECGADSVALNSAPIDSQVGIDTDFPNAVLARCVTEIDANDFYANLRDAGLEYGPSFQAVHQLWRNENEAIARILPHALISSIASSDRGRYLIHPAVLDACGQVLLILAPKHRVSFVPTGIDRVRLYAEASESHELWVHATLSGADQSHSESYTGNARILDKTGNLIALIEGLRMQTLQDRTHSAAENADNWLHEIHWRELPLAESPARSSSEKSWLILADGSDGWKSLINKLVTSDQTCVVLHAGSELRRHPSNGDSIEYDICPDRSDHIASVLDNEFVLKGRPCTGVVHLWSLSSGIESMISSDALCLAQTLGVGSAVRVVQEILKAGLEPRVWLVTQGVQRLDAHADHLLIPTHAPLWGLCRTITNEHPELRCSAIDLPVEYGERELLALSNEIRSDDVEDQVGFNDGRRYVARLVRTCGSRLKSLASQSRRRVPVWRPYQVGLSTPGDLDNLRLVETQRSAPGPDEIEIEVHAAALNFRDVLKALGIYPGTSDGPIQLGDECAGTVVAVGTGVNQFQKGDEVIALAPACLGRYVTVSAHLACRKPAHLGFEEAAGIPVAFLTSHYALNHLARLAKGERILIHAAAGGVGLAAVKIAQEVGAEIMATAGSEVKRDYLRSLGIRHLFNSRSLSFADEVLRVTGGKGVDVVLNSLAGPAIAKSLSVLAPYGRFLEIGKRDIYENSRIGLGPFQNSLSFHAIDMEKLVRERPHLFVSLFREVMGRFTQGEWQPIVSSIFPISDVVQAFRHLSQALNIGKVVITLAHSEADLPTPDSSSLLRPDRTYLITGGLGQLGSEVACWMVERGARNLALLGRSSTPNARIEELRCAPVRIEVIQADVSDAGSLHAAFEQVRRTMPELAGIMHAAGVLHDSLLLRMDDDQLWSVMAPKVAGATNLHFESLASKLDFFVMFSSVTAAFGTPGQANYAAGNAFLDALARYRRQRGLPAISIQWGPWDEIGMAASGLNRKLIGGIRAIPPALGLDMLEELIRADMSGQLVANMDWPQWLKQYGTRNTSLFADFRNHAACLDSRRSTSEFRRKVDEADISKRQELIASFMASEMARVLQVDISRIDINVGLDTVGLDSLMAVEYKTRLETEIGFNLPIVRLLNGPTISEVSAFIADSLGPKAAAAEGQPVETVSSLVTSNGAVLSREHEDIIVN